MARRCWLLVLLLAACNDGRNYVRVSVGSITNFSAAATLQVTVTNNGQTGTVNVPVPTNSQRPDPFDFSLEFDPARTGQVGIDIEARNGSGGPLARGTTTITIAKGIVQAPLTLQQLPAPSVNNLSPIHCHFPGGGAQIFVNGANFVSGSVVLWGNGSTPLNTTVNSSGQLEILTPRGFDNTDVDVVVRNPDGQTSNNNVQFYYRSDPLLCPQ